MSRRLPAHGVLAEFFDVTKDSRDIFKDTAIMQTEYARDINSYPTIFLSFADAKGDKDNIVMQMKLQLLKEYKKNEQHYPFSVILMAFCHQKADSIYNCL